MNRFDTRHPGAGRDPAVQCFCANRRWMNSELGPGLRRDDILFTHTFDSSYLEVTATIDRESRGQRLYDSSAPVVVAGGGRTPPDA